MAKIATVLLLFFVEFLRKVLLEPVREEWRKYRQLQTWQKKIPAGREELLSLTGEKINLINLKGKLVLLDFFYKGCFPCMLALQALQELNEKYKDRGLIIIGIDPSDKKEDDIASFLSKRGVTYQVILGGEDVSIDYRVSSFPTMYLIDKNGKIIFTHVGYAKETDNILDEVIKKNL